MLLHAETQWRTDGVYILVIDADDTDRRNRYFRQAQTEYHYRDPFVVSFEPEGDVYTLSNTPIEDADARRFAVECGIDPDKGEYYQLGTVTVEEEVDDEEDIDEEDEPEYLPIFSHKMNLLENLK